MAQEFKNLLDLGGLRTDTVADKIPDRNASDVQNIDFSLNGVIQTRLGYSRFGNHIEAEGKCLNAFLFRKNFGTKQNIFLRVRTSSSESVLEYFNPDNVSAEHPDGYFEKLLDGLTPLAQMGFAIANGDGGEKINKVIMGNAHDNMMEWNGALATVESVTADSITVEETIATEGFNSTVNKKLIIDGTEYEYTGINDKTFTGVTADPSAIAVGTVVTQAVDTDILEEHLSTGTTFSFNSDGGDGKSTIDDTANSFINDGFTAGQKIVIGGSEKNDGVYTIDSVAAGTLTLIASDYLKDETAGENVVIAAGVPKGSVLTTSQRKLWVAGNLDNQSKVYYSQSGDVTCFGITSGLGSGGSFDLIEGSGRINLLEARGKNVIIIHKTDAIIAYSRESLDALNVREIFETIAEGNDVGGVNTKARSGYNSSSYFMTGVEGVKSLERVINEDLLEVDSITNIIFPTLKDYDNSNASMVYYSAKRALFVATNNSDGDRVVLSIYIKGNKQEGIFYDISIDILPVEDWLVDGDDLFFVSSLDQNTYKMFSRNSDDAVQAEHSWISKDFTFEEPARGKTFPLLYLEGYIKERTKIKVSIIYGIGGSRGIKEKVIHWDDTSVVSTTALGALGTEILGESSLGSSNFDLFHSRYFGYPIHFDVNKSTRFKIKLETIYDEADAFDKEAYWAISNISFNPNLDTVMYNEMENSSISKDLDGKAYLLLEDGSKVYLN